MQQTSSQFVMNTYKNISVMKLAMRPVTRHTVCTLKDQHEELALAEICELISVCISEWERRLQGTSQLKVV